MESSALDSRLRLIQPTEMRNRVVLVRVDHNVVKQGKIKDPYRIDATLGTLYSIAEKGGRPILMTHVGRPRDKKTGRIRCLEEESILPVARYLSQKLHIEIHVPTLPIDPEKGILDLDGLISPALNDLKNGKIGMIYLPNTRWFQGEQSSGPERERLTLSLVELADIFVNDAFGSWQAHASTYDVAKKMPSCAGTLLQKELINLHQVLHPKRPFVGIIAGAKYDTKIGPLKALYKKVDHLVLGGILYNTFLAAKYGLEMAGVPAEGKALARDLVEMDEKEKKILELPFLTESDTLEGRVDGRYRTVDISEFKQGKKLRYILDIDPKSMKVKRVEAVFRSAKTFFVNAVMGLMPHFFEGSRSLYRMVASNRDALKLYGGGDTLQELRNLCPGIYISGIEDDNTYYFTGGGSVLSAIAQGSPYHLKPVAALMEP